MRLKTAFPAFIALAFVIASGGSLSVYAQKASTSIHSKDDEWNMTRSDNGREVRVRLKGEVEFNQYLVGL